MVFTKLSAQEKDAFFGLLDEYFQSRPELFGQGHSGQGVSGLASTGISTTAAASAVQRALAAGTTSSHGGAPGKSNNPYAAALATASSADVARAVTVGRVAAASLAFSGSQGQAAGGGGIAPSPANANANDPQSLLRRITSNVPVPAPAEQPGGSPGSEVDKLITRKTSVFSTFKKQQPAGVVIPSAFVAPKNTYGPPPVRRVTSETNAGTGAGAGAGTSATTRGGGTRTLQQQAAVAQQQQQQQPEEQAEVAEGEWAEVLYDYSSEDPGDLAIEAGTRVFVTARSSEDWWTGQVEGQGREGLFPASYVKLL